MKKDAYFIIAIVILIGVAGTLFVLRNDANTNYGNMPRYDNKFTESMSEHAGHMMPMMVSSEREFIEAMIPHHQEAVDTAREVLERGGTTEEIRSLAAGIVTSQEKEIADMKRWYEEWYGNPYVGTGTYTPMMRELASLNEAELDKAFLTDMIMHHMGAIMMARSVESLITHDELSKLTTDIIRTQSEEIEEMERSLSRL